MAKIWRLFFKPRRTHYRADGPVVINPEIREVIHVKG